MTLIECIKKHCLKKNQQINGKCNTLLWWKNNGLELFYEQILLKTSFLPKESSMSIRFYHILNRIDDIPNCLNTECENKVNWQFSNNTYAKYCSRKCTAISNKKIGKDNPFANIDVQHKIKQTNVKKYGYDNFSKTVEFSTQMKDYHKNLSLDQQQKTQNKREQTNLLKYGTITPLTNPEVQFKIEQTMLLNYGVRFPLQNYDIKARATCSSIDRYGREHFNQQHMSIETIQNLHNKFWLESQLSLFSTKQIAKNCNISYSVLCKYINRAGIDLTTYSWFEQEIKEFIKTILTPDDIIITNDRNVLDGKEIDIYIPSLGIGIECNGVYWHREGKGKHQKYHINKTVAASQKGIRLIHIFENEWVEKKAIVENRLRLLLNNSDRRFGRKCKIITLNTTEETHFLKEFHLQGPIYSKVCYGLTYNGQIVSIMSFGKARYTKKVDWELLRYATRDNMIILGGAEKLFKHFLKQNTPESIVSYCDRRWFTGNIYLKLGFCFSHNSIPNYFYLEPNGSLSSRVKYQKHKLKNILLNFNPTLSEWNNMQNNGYDRIWDCGNSVWIWNK